MFDKLAGESGGTTMARSETAQMVGRGPTVRERLEQQLYVLETRADNVRAAIKALDDNPGSEAVLDALSKAGM